MWANIGWKKNMNPIEFGAQQAVQNCVCVKPGESVAIVTDLQTKTLADAIKTQIDHAGAHAYPFIMEDFGERPECGTAPLAFPEVMRELLSRSQVSFYIAQCRPGELKSFRMPMIETVKTQGIRHAHMPGFTEIMMSQGMAADYEAIARLCQQVHDIVSPAREIHVTSPAGTDLHASFSPDLQWVISDGYIEPSHWKNLPDGEVFTAPVDAQGLVVVDGCFGDFFCKKYGQIQDTPLCYELKHGRCIEGSVSCDHDQLKQDFIAYTFGTDENAPRLGEFAIGTNIGLTELIGNILQDEKFPGIHLALGNPYPDKTGANWHSDAHNDGLLRDPTIVVDGQTIMEEGTFLI